MRIVDTDNFGGDYPDEKFLAWVDSDGKARPAYFYNEREAVDVCHVLNGPRLDNARYFKAVPDDYKLVPGFTP